ncbi:TetR/AcrR family transcriptional regulator [Kutzneria viridogrisea]|uniref:HTH tetR-type domain-containing protein n=2 Tax=Kutzneria TaxID=43356 RepID=W5W6G2_9PSEU|nr:TetR/AcrR family transcriptional regulator [Kutzneria albida]AHH96355.1 hypothetical protein KALB_2987 [Kutzneria albida DSM 43870]MBA8928430.1 AcrR family transcriptional regulator [Kutzneria viridogrisea]
MTRRTQQERREATVAKLVDATISAIVELGYHRTSVQAICGRAGLSVGAMFRQFDSRLDLVVAAVEEVVARHLAHFREHLAALAAEEDVITASLRFLRQATGSPLTHVLREVLIAARTEQELRSRVRPTIHRYYSAIFADAEHAGVLAPLPPEHRENVVHMMVHLFSGEALITGVDPRPEQAEAQLQLARRMLLTLAGTD